MTPADRAKVDMRKARANTTVAVEDLEEGSNRLKTIPPGFARGLRLPGDDAEAGEDLVAEIQVSRPSVGGDIPVRLLHSGFYLWARC